MRAECLFGRCCAVYDMRMFRVCGVVSRLVV